MRTLQDHLGFSFRYGSNQLLLKIRQRDHPTPQAVEARSELRVSIGGWVRLPICVAEPKERALVHSFGWIGLADRSDIAGREQSVKQSSRVDELAGRIRP